MTGPDPVAAWIARTYPHARRVVEAGVGHAPWTAIAIARALPGAEVCAVDPDPCAVACGRSAAAGRVRVEAGTLEGVAAAQRAADVLYAVRPPPELLATLEAAADRLQAHAVVATLSDDAPHGRPGWQPVREAGRSIAWVRSPGGAP